jgi:hypothetical protein
LPRIDEENMDEIYKYEMISYDGIVNTLIDTGHTVRSLVSMLEGGEVHDNWTVQVDGDGKIVLVGSDGVCAIYGRPPTPAPKEEPK